MLKKKAPKKKVEPDPVLDGEIPDYEQAGFDDEFADLVARKVMIQAKIKRLTEQEAEVKEELLALMETSEHPSVQVGDYRVIRSEGVTRKTLDPKLLLKNGCPADAITKSTVESTGKPFVRVVEAKGE